MAKGKSEINAMWRKVSGLPEKKRIAKAPAKSKTKRA